MGHHHRYPSSILHSVLLISSILTFSLLGVLALARRAAGAPPPLPLSDVVLHMAEPTPAVGLDLSTDQAKLPWVLVRLVKTEYIEADTYTSTDTYLDDVTLQNFRFAHEFVYWSWACKPCRFPVEVTLHAAFPPVIPAEGQIEFSVNGTARWEASGEEFNPFWPNLNEYMMDLSSYGNQGQFWPGAWCSPEGWNTVTKTLAINTGGNLSSRSCICPISTARLQPADPEAIYALSATSNTGYYQDSADWYKWLTADLEVQAQYKQALYRMTLTSDRQELAPSPGNPSQAVLSVLVTDTAGNPAPGERIRFRLDPNDMGRLLSSTAVTDAAGRAQVVYQAPTGAELQGRVAVTVYARNESHAATLPPEAEQLINIVGNELTIQLEPEEVQIGGMNPFSLITVQVRRKGQPVTGVRVDLSIEPNDLGDLDKAFDITDAAGNIHATYRAPSLSELQGRDRVLLRVREQETGTEATAHIRFKGLQVVSTTPTQESTRCGS